MTHPAPPRASRRSKCPSWRAAAGRLAPAILVVALVSGCGGGPARRDFAGKVNGACARSVKRIADRRPSTPHEALPYAISVFEEKDQLLSWLRSIDLPSADAKTLRARWLTPAQRDLRRYFPRLARVRAAVLSGDRERISAELEALTRSGRQGVDGELLSGYGLGACRDLFAGSRPAR